MAYRLAFEIAYTGASGIPMALGDTFDFTQLSMLSDGKPQTYTTQYLTNGSVNDTGIADNNFATGEDLFLNGGTIGATGTAYRMSATEADQFDVSVKFYAPSDPSADANGLITLTVRMIHFQLVNPLNAADVRDVMIVHYTQPVAAVTNAFYSYPAVSGTVSSGSLQALSSWSINRVIDDQNFTIQQPGVPAICFAKGTKIETSTGSRAIEDLKAGDVLRTMDGGWQPIRWVGARSVVGRGKFAPIMIEAGALGNTEPLVVSKQHRLLMRNSVCDLYFGSP